jgi:acyl carrier protein
VTDKNAISALFTEIANTLPPLKGLVHAATVINDGLIRNMDANQIRSVLEPKALGAYYLHEMTLDTPLDFFILYSSATTLFGNPGQANYVAANACLEALALQRRAKGLPATCVAWGAIDDVGYLASNKKIKDALQNRMGGAALNSDIALDILENMLLSDRSNLGVMDLDWQTLSKFLPSADSPKFIELTQDNSDDDRQHDSAEDIQQMLLELSDADLLTTLIAMIKSEVGEILRIAPDKIDPSKSIYDMGLDSLMGVELIVALESRFSIRLPVMALSESPTITKLTERIIQQLKGNGEQETDSDQTELLTRTQQIIAQHVTDDPSQLITNLVNDLQNQSATTPDRIIN